MKSATTAAVPSKVIKLIKAPNSKHHLLSYIYLRSVKRNINSGKIMENTMIPLNQIKY